MSENIVEYSYDATNDATIVFVPGYSGGLDSLVLRTLRGVFIERGGTNVFGIEMEYERDTPDSFDGSQELLRSAVEVIAKKAPGTDVVVMGKSIGGALALAQMPALRVAKIVVLGPSLVLGWPQRISLLKSETTILPNYKAEWNTMLKSMPVPVLFLCGDRDNLTDVGYLSDVASRNSNIKVEIVEGADHGLVQIDNNDVPLPFLMDRIDQFLKT